MTLLENDLAFHEIALYGLKLRFPFSVVPFHRQVSQAHAGTPQSHSPFVRSVSVVSSFSDLTVRRTLLRSP